MKTKIMAGIALTAIAATGVVGGFAIANGNLNSAVNATNAKSIVYNGSINQYVAGSESYVAKTIATGSFSGDSGVSTNVGGMTGEALTGSDGTNYCVATPDSGKNGMITFAAGCTGMTSITIKFTGTGATATYGSYTSSSMSGSTGSGSLTSGTASAFNAGTNFVMISLSISADQGALSIQSITLSWAC
jgi:hypothetical protein